jgi:hypothetical protein
MRILLSSLALLLIAWPAGADMIFHSAMGSAAEITSPDVGTAGTIPGAAHVTYVAGVDGNAAQVDNTSESNGVIWFPMANFDFPDTAQDGGRLDVVLRFDEEPQTYTANAWVLRTDYPDRRINIEMTGGALMFDVYGEIAHNDRTNYEKFRINPRATDEWNGVNVTEWHTFTWLWRNNGDNHKDEIHYYIDGVWVGSDYNGNLPIDSQLDQLQICPRLSGNEIDVTIDDIYGFDEWDMTGVPAGQYATLVEPEGVWVTFPQDKDQPIYASPVDGAYLELAWRVKDDEESVTDCDIYINGDNVGTVSSTSQAYMEWLYPTPLIVGNPHYVIVKCDGDRLESSRTDLNMNTNTGVTMVVDWTVPNDQSYIVDSVQVRWDFDTAPTTVLEGALVSKFATNQESGSLSIKGIREAGDVGVYMAHRGTLYNFPLEIETDWTDGITTTTTMTRVIQLETLDAYPTPR